MREFSGTAAAAEREKTEKETCSESENKSVKHGGWKKGNKRLRRSLRLGSTEDEETSELPLTSMTSLSQIPVPGSGVRQGKLQRSLKKSVSDDTTSNMEEEETGSPTSIGEVKDKQSSAGRGRTEKKNKLTTSFPRRRWSWRSKKTDLNYCELSSHKEHQRSGSDSGDGRQPSSHSSSRDRTTAKTHNECTSPPPTMHSVADSWSSPTPNSAFSKHTSM